MKKSFIVAVIITLLQACASPYATNGENLYLKSRNGPHLIVPAPLTGSDISHFYDLPPQEKDAKVSIMPPSF